MVITVLQLTVHASSWTALIQKMETGGKTDKKYDVRLWGRNDQEEVRAVLSHKDQQEISKIEHS